ncbi:MAG: methionyl-tRNA formyltransferase [Clostridiales bacterium]|jgi:methionyl-tRNA formyltransferase|nr:methionyl-tRNA formyltransferase [Clostridiales bacterium]
MKVVFMGTPDFAVPTLVELVNAGHDVVAVITQPDKPKGRGNLMQFPPVKEKALEYNIPIYQPTKVRAPEFVDFLTQIAPDIIVVAAFGQILSKSIIDLPKYGCINVHASLLPRYRGAAPIQWAVINGEEVAGVTIMHMDVGIDTGDMISKASVTVDKDDTGGSLQDKLSLIGSKLLIETLPMLENGTSNRTKQCEEDSTYFSMLRKELGNIEWSKSAVEIERLIRGLNPWPSAYTTIDGKTLKIWKADVIDKDYDAEPGTLVEVEKDLIIVQTGNKCLALIDLQLEGKKRMTVDSFLRGYKVNKYTILRKA